MPQQAAIASPAAAEVSSVRRLAQFFPEAVAVRIPVRATVVRENGAAHSHALEEKTIIEFGTTQEALFASSLPLEFDDHVRLENADGSLLIDAAVVAVQYHAGQTAIAARFNQPVSNWIIKR